MPSHLRAAWVRLGELLIRRRIELDPRYSNRRVFEAERWPDHYRTINALEKGQRDNYEPGTIAAVEAAYKLEPGAIRRFLDGGDLETAESAGASVTQFPAPYRSSWRPVAREGALISPLILPKADKLMPGIKAHVAAALRKYPDPAGRQVFPDDAYMAGVWDSVRRETDFLDPAHPDTPQQRSWFVALSAVREVTESGENPATG